MNLHLFSLSLLVLHCLQNVAVHAEIISAPTSNVTVPLGQTTPAVFTCTGRGLFTNWVINGTEIPDSRKYAADKDDVEANQMFNPNGSVSQIIKFGINLKWNNTKLSCLVRQRDSTVPNVTSPNVNSSTVVLVIAGPPLKPSPMFQVVNSTHIKVEWNKTFALPEFDVKYYTLTTANTSTDTSIQETFNASVIEDYPLVHYLSNKGVIPQDCVYLNFTLTATNEAGTSDEGFTTGGFAIAPSPLSTDSFFHWVTFSADGLDPMLHVNFTFPTVCDYHDAYYSVAVMDANQDTVVETPKFLYDKDGPDEVTVVLEGKMMKDYIYDAEIRVITAVATEVTRFSFATKLKVNSSVGGIVTRVVTSPEDNQKTIIASAVAFGLLVVLFLLITILLAVYIARRRKIKRTYRAQQQEIRTDEAVQRAAQAMIPNPIYSGNPIYEEIADAKMLKSLKKVGVSEAPQRDGGYVELSADAAVRMVSAYPIPEESKLVVDKYATITDETYTLMNPVGTLTHQLSTPTHEAPNAGIPQQFGNSTEPHTTTEVATVTTSNGHCTGSAQITSGSFSNLDEERYVMAGSYY